jgi:hypothetical protein
VVNDVRIGKFKQRISDMLAQGDLGQFQKLIEQYEQEHNVPAIEIAAALARIAQGDQPLLLAPPPKREKYEPPHANASTAPRHASARVPNAVRRADARRRPAMRRASRGSMNSGRANKVPMTGPGTSSRAISPTVRCARTPPKRASAPIASRSATSTA